VLNAENPIQSTMAVADRLRRSIERLPTRLQEEVLDYAEFLLSKTEREAEAQDHREWRQFSLESAMRGIEEKDEAEYSESDLKERFSA
jgi:galactose-1-phosphate uridylyltransferase